MCDKMIKKQNANRTTEYARRKRFKKSKRKSLEEKYPELVEKIFRRLYF